MFFRTESTLIWYAVVVLCLSVLTLGASQVQACSLTDQAASVDVKQVIDGDTVILVDDRIVRLVGINTPELARPKKYVKEQWQAQDQLLAQEARTALTRLLKSGTTQLMPSISHKDKYGRELAYIYVEGRNVVESMLRQGLGFALAVAPDVYCTDDYFAAEKEARRQHIGVWRLYSPIVAANYNEYARSGFALISGLVTRVSTSRRATWIDLDDTVVAMIPRKRVADFMEPVTSYEGQFVELRGWVIDRQKDRPLPSYKKRWMVTITHPAMLQIVRS